MWKHLKNMECLSDSRLYGETIFRLSQLTHKISEKNIADTIVLSSDFFERYIENRYINEDIITDCIKELGIININEDADIVVSMSVYKECNINNESITTRANPTSIKNALISIYERWFDGKPYSYRIAHKLKKEETYPSIYIQCYSNSKLFSMITRHPSSGELMSSVESWNLIHCTVPIKSEKERKIVSTIDSVFVLPQKIYFYYDSLSQDIIITSLVNYHMTRNAYISCLIEKHRNNIIDNKCFIEYINESDIIRFEGYTLYSQHSYKGLGVSPGYANGKAVFYFSDFEKILQDNTGNYIFFAIEISPEDIAVLKHCKGAIFSRGGMTTHGAAACRGLGIAAITGTNIIFDKANNMVLTDFETIKEGDDIYISAYENYWCKNGRFEPLYRANINEHPLLYFLDVMKKFRNDVEIPTCSIDFQRHFATIIRALKKAGYDI